MTLSTRRRIRPCQVCGSTQHNQLYTNELAPIGGLDMSYQVSTCNDCGFMYASELPASSVYEAYYRELSKYDVMASVAEIRPVDRVRMSATVELCRPHLPADALIVDIGCGTGALLDAFKTAGWTRLYGIDPAPEAAAKAATLFGLHNVTTGTLKQAATRLPLGQAGLVCVTGVLEHLPDLHSDLDTLIAAMHPAAKILVEVPALECFVRTPMEAYGEFSLEHIQYFSAESLRKLMTQLGYTCLSSDIVALSAGVTDSLFALFARGTQQHAVDSDNVVDPAGYIRQSEIIMRQTLQRIADCPATQFIIYGAGSHTARLLPRLDVLGLSGRIAGIVDSNPNLQEQRIGRHVVSAPDTLSNWPIATVVISSFNAQSAIADFVAHHYSNPILQLYP